MRILSRSVKETIKIGKSLSKFLSRGDILLLEGDLGSGKTVFVKGLAEGQGINQDKVLSPTFVLMRQYQGKNIQINHLDLYRLHEAGEFATLGSEEYFYDEALTVIEWAKKLKGFFIPADYLEIKFSLISDKERLIKIEAQGEHYKNILSCFTGNP
mgnify:CR=1 FL=1